MSARNHVFVERIVNPYGDDVRLPPSKQMRAVYDERGITFADVFSGGFSIHPDFCGMKYRFEFDPHCEILPLPGYFESSPIPCGAVIVLESRLDLPGMRHAHFEPCDG